MLQPKQYKYATRLTWTGERKGLLGCWDKPDIEVACPPEWGGHPGIWSPEDLFVGSVEVCVMTTFLWLAGREGLELTSYESEADMVARMSGGEFGVEAVRVRPRVTVTSGEDREKAAGLMAQVPKWCLVSKSLAPEVIIEHNIILGDPCGE